MEPRPYRDDSSRFNPIDPTDSSLPASTLPAQSLQAKSGAGSALLAWPGSARPLSDIRELSETSIADDIARKPNAAPRHQRSASRTSSVQLKPSIKRVGSNASAKRDFERQHGPIRSQDGDSSSCGTPPERPNVYSIPYSSVPRRSSSLTRAVQSGRVDTQENDLAHVPFHQDRSLAYTPVRDAECRRNVLPREGSPRNMPQTRVRHPPPIELLMFPRYKHPRVKLDMHVSAPLFVGGGSVEGNIRLTVDGSDHLKHRRSLSIGTMSVDLLGFEDVSSSRRAIFLALGIDLIDGTRPPPPELVEHTHPVFIDGDFWPLAPTMTSLPFRIALPLHTGPPPFQSKHACIRFLLVVTASLRDTGKVYRVRISQDVHVLPTYDPEKALTSLRSPLTACDELALRSGNNPEGLRLTASLHRQVWVSGGNIFVEVNICNTSRKAVRRLELALERDILLYKHTAAATLEKSASQARIFESNEQTILVKATFKPGATGWDGVDPLSSDLRTYELALPSGHGTVRCGKYFEVRYFLNVTAIMSSSRRISVQIPIILIHINSLDVVPNAIVQVAAAIEEKRANLHQKRSRSQRLGGRLPRQNSGSSSLGTDLRRRPSYGQGRAFAAPRQQSLDRQREQRAEIDELRNVLDHSPRKLARPPAAQTGSKQPASSASLNSLATKQSELDALHRTSEHVRRRPTNESNRSEAPSLRSRLRGMRSLETFRGRTLLGKDTVRGVVCQPSEQVEQRIALQTCKPGAACSLNPVTGKHQFSDAGEKPGSVRVDTKTIKEKASGRLRGKGLTWLEQRRNHRDRDREKDREGWI